MSFEITGSTKFWLRFYAFQDVGKSAMSSKMTSFMHACMHALDCYIGKFVTKTRNKIRK